MRIHTRPSWNRRATVATAARYLGAAALLAAGVDHLEQYAVDHYDAIRTIGTLFLLNFVSAVVVTVALAAPVERLARREARALLALAALAGIGIAAGSLAGLFVSESSGLFGFMEQGYRTAIVVSIVLEVAAIVLLGLFLATGPALRRRPAGRVRF